MKNKKFKYKGFIGDCQYSKYDKLYYGSILNTSDLVNYDGKNYVDAYNDFKDSVDTYISFCAEIGLKKLNTPKMFYTSKFFIFIQIIKNIFSMKTLNRFKKIDVKNILTHGKDCCIVLYNKQKKIYHGLVFLKNKKMQIKSHSLNDINNKFKQMRQAHRDKYEKRKYIILNRSIKNE